MKSIFFAVLVSCGLLLACHSAKTVSAAAADASKLEGSWELNYILSPGASFDSLYSAKKPVIQFDIANNKVFGNTGCNNFNGPLKIDGNKIDFTQPMAMTWMMCPGNGENVFIETLKKVNRWALSGDNMLTFISGDIAVMRFVKK